VAITSTSETTQVVVRLVDWRNAGLIEIRYGFALASR